MTRKTRQAAGFSTLGLVGIYSWIMTATAGAAPWAWLLLVAAMGLLAVAASGRRSVPKGRHDG